MSFAHDLFQRSHMKKTKPKQLMKDPLASLTVSQFDSVSWGNSSWGTTFCLPRFLPASSWPPRKNIQLSMLHDKIDYPWTSSKTKPFLYICNAANVLESFKIKATLLINLYFYIPCSWKIQLKHYSDLLPENDCHSEDRIRRHPKQSSSKNGIDRERDSCSCFTSVTGVVKGGLLQ